MLLTLIVYAQSLRWVIPASVMLGSAPCFLVTWTGMRVLTALLPRGVYRQVDDALFSMYQRMVLFFYEHYTGVEVILYGDVDALKGPPENVIYISNHQSTVDWIVSEMMALRKDSLGQVRYVLKDGLKFFPMYGFYLYQHSCIFVKRSGKFNKSRAEKELSKMNQYGVPRWMVIFPEGTRYNPELPDVIAKSRQFAVDQGHAPFSQVLQPRHKAVKVCLDALRPSMDAFYDATLAYSASVGPGRDRVAAPSMPDFLSGVSKQLHIHLKRIPITDVPEDEEQLKAFLHKRFEEKEALLNHFFGDEKSQPCSFPGEGKVSRLSLLSTLPSMLLWSGLTTAILATKEGRSFYWKAGLVGTVAGCVWMAARV